jgi:hypothetical protein
MLVAPGEMAHFSFDLAAEGAPSEEWFALVIDGEVWLPGTMFKVVRQGA